MQMCRLCLFRSRSTFAPAEFLFQEAKGFFDLLPMSIIVFDPVARLRKFIRQIVFSAVFDDQYLMFDLSQRAGLATEPVMKQFVNPHFIKQPIAFDSADLSPTERIYQIQQLGRRIPTVKQDKLRTYAIVADSLKQFFRQLYFRASTFFPDS